MSAPAASRRAMAAAALVAITLVAGCRQTPEPRAYEIVGQILAVRPEHSEIILKHHDITGFMPGMTMPFKVEPASRLEGLMPGDLVRGTLLVGEVDVHIAKLDVTGHQALDAPLPATEFPEILETGQSVADAPLVDQDGRPMTLAALRGHRVALTFVYTRCPLPDYCPLMERNFVEVQRAVKASAALADVRLVSVTMDPEYDTPAVLKPHAQGFGADPAVWSFATGDPAVVRQFASQFGITYERDAQNTWQLIHNLRTVIIGADGTLATAISGNTWTPAGVVADLASTPAAVH